MPRSTGTLSMGDLLAAKVALGSSSKFSPEAVAETLRADNESYNRVLSESLSMIAKETTDTWVTSAGSTDGTMMEANEFSRVPTQKATTGQMHALPLRQFQYAIGWTRQFERNATVADYATSQIQAQTSNTKRVQYELMKALFNPTNYTSNDVLVNNAELPVKALINADSSQIPNGPYGEAFDGSTHTHYTANNGLDVSKVQAAVENLIEHGYQGEIRIHIALGNEAAFRLLTGFIAYSDVRTVPNLTGGDARKQVDTYKPTSNRAIGLLGSAEVWVKPWVPTNYLHVMDVSSPDKPLGMRLYNKVPKGLHFEADVETFPLRAEYQENYFGFGAWKRLNSVIHRFDNGTYAAPSFTY